jgi:hypothetical protein
MTMNTQRSISLDHILMLDIDKQGNVRKRLPKLDAESTLENTLLQFLYPGIRVATVNVPLEPLDDWEEMQVETAMQNLVVDNIRYKLVGASGSSKKGKFYFVDYEHADAIAKRFQNWPQAAMVYFGILVSPCKVVIEEPEATVLVVKDHVLGTNDCRGWIRQSLFTKLGLAPNCFYQFRLAFHQTQAKGSFKVMDDEVADALEADIILPESAVKPELKIPVKFFSIFGKEGRTFRGPIVLGIREQSRPLEFDSSYTLVEHAPEDSIRLEILPEALRSVQKVSEALTEGQYGELLELLGRRVESQAPLDWLAPEEEELRPVECLLLADKSGYMVRHPYVNLQLNKVLARWAFKASTGGGFRLPAFALADDGYLVWHEGKVYAGSDWIPQNKAIVPLESKRGLCVRYPIRMSEDLLPFSNMALSETVDVLGAHLSGQGCRITSDLLSTIIAKQLRLEGTYILHSETAKKNGGDYDFDWICVLEEDRFPRFVNHRFNLGDEFKQEKTKATKAKSPWWNLEHVAMKARGNQIGSVTDLKTSCMAAGRYDLAYQLVVELQNALDALKHNVEPDRNVIAEIRQQVVPAPWLRLKNERQVSDMPLHLEVFPSDKIGFLYNHVRKEIQELMSGHLPIEDFKGLITDEMVTREMLDECRFVSAVYRTVVGQVMEREKQVKEAMQHAEAAWDAVRKHPDKEFRKQKLQARSKAKSAWYQNQEVAKEEMSSVIFFLRVWAQSKEENRMGWCQALNTTVCHGTGTGSILFHSFPQELVDKTAERTGGKRVRVALPAVRKGYIHRGPDDRVFVGESHEGGEKLVFLFQYKDGKILLDNNPTAQA